MDFDNLFDEALSDADDRIIDTMGKNIIVSIHGVDTPVRAVFDEPAADSSLPGGAAIVEDVAPTLFVKTALIAGLKKRDAVSVAGEPFWVVKVGPDDTGTCTVTLARGQPGDPAPLREGRTP
ncbi:hypothetical protein I7V27_13460 [Lelliottia amnigena]|uniref:Phage tail protein n=1 Tax=Lelliottia amnigena TaxID=61646 RepID=A0AAP2F0I1_LELAM|nr:head-tail joining protein [Lelliottia amnigena]MBL5899932.1 hypothetical protein [Lelliottia amnigena]MBL5935446.1 hypothetical protein [Lelliottia amnigena]